MIGIFTRYRKADSTLAALAVARALERKGIGVSIYGTEWRARSVDLVYDNKIHDGKFFEWTKRLRHIIWLMPVDEYFIKVLKRRGVKNILYCSWLDITPFDQDVLPLYDQILMPSPIQVIRLRDKLSLDNVACMPYSPDLPITRPNQGKLSKIRLFMSLYGSQLKRVDLESLEMLSRLCEDFKSLHVTVACSKGLGVHAKNKLRLYGRRYPIRWTNKHNLSWQDHNLLMGEHNLTVWPARSDGFGIMGTTSLHMGVPVVAWGISPISEVLSGGRNSMLVSCDGMYDWISTPTVTSDYTEYEKVLRWLLDKPQMIQELTKHTQEKMFSRVSEFHKTLGVLIPE